jgi:hypothetical protein
LLHRRDTRTSRVKKYRSVFAQKGGYGGAGGDNLTVPTVSVVIAIRIVTGYGCDMVTDLKKVWFIQIILFIPLNFCFDLPLKFCPAL